MHVRNVWQASLVLLVDALMVKLKVWVWPVFCHLFAMLNVTLELLFTVHDDSGLVCLDTGTQFLSVFRGFESRSLCSRPPSLGAMCPVVMLSVE